MTVTRRKTKAKCSPPCLITHSLLKQINLNHPFGDAEFEWSLSLLEASSWARFASYCLLSSACGFYKVMLIMKMKTRIEGKRILHFKNHRCPILLVRLISSERKNILV